jgi:hypothetical protein
MRHVIISLGELHKMKVKWAAVELGNYGSKERTKSMRAAVYACGGYVVNCGKSDVATLSTLCATHKVMFAYTSGEHTAERMAREYLACVQIPLVILDLGYFKRASGAHDRVGYNQVGIGRIGWVPGEDDARPFCPARWESLGIGDCAPPTSNKTQNLLVLGQVPNDSQHKLSVRVLNSWYDDQVRKIVNNRSNVIFRPHPKALREPVPSCANQVSTPCACSLADAIASASVVVTYNSTAGLDAILAGVPVICSPSAHYAHIADYGRNNGKVTAEMVMRHMHKLAYSQWTCAEIETGAPLRYLFPAITCLT